MQCDYGTVDVNRGPCNVVTGLRNVIMGAWYMNNGPSNVNRVPRSAIMGPWNVNRGLECD